MQPNTSGGMPPGVYHPVTVNLTPRAFQALEQAAKLTHDTQTDTINRALQIYSYIAGITCNHGDVYVRDNGSAELERLSVRGGWWRTW